jgi:hypothetical protein
VDVSEGFGAYLDELDALARDEILRAQDAVELAREELHRAIPDEDLAFNNPYWQKFAGGLDDYRRFLEEVLERAGYALERSSADLSKMVNDYRDADRHAATRLLPEER